MDLNTRSLKHCPIAHGLSLVGDDWSMLLLRDAGAGLTRFDQFRTSLGIAPNILAKRLKAMTEAGLLARRSYSERPPRDEYLITEAGRDFLPVLQAIGAWAHRHAGAGTRLSQTIDTKTGVPVSVVVIDRNTDAPIGSRPLRLEQPG